MTPALREAWDIRCRNRDACRLVGDPDLKIWQVPIPPLDPETDAELIAEATALCQDKPSIQLNDLRNAYGEVSRQLVLMLCLAVLPSFTAAFFSCYGCETLTLLTRGLAIWMSTGFTQGDAFANPGFALVAWYLSVIIRNAGAACIQYWDDTVMYGIVATVAATERAIVQVEHITRCVLRPDKCHCHVADQVTADLIMMAGLFRRPNLPYTS